MNIVFLVAFPFPYGEASSIRALNICKLLSYAGHSVHVISDFLSSNAYEADSICTYEGCLLSQPPIYKRFIRPKASMDALINYCNKHKVDCVLANARSDRFFSLASYCNKKNIPLFIENCEWYDISSFKLGVFDWRYYRNQRMLQEGFKKVDGFISISRFLNEHNSSYGKKTVRIPTIMDTSKVVYSYENHNKKLTLVYTGNPGTSKEYLAPIITALSEDEVLKRSVEFHIYGPSIKTVIKNIHDSKLLQKAGDSVIVHGKIEQQKMPIIMCEADYLVFVRPNRRSSNAGFPTKFGESMAAGTPVITNDTGDISLYLKDGVNGFLLNDGNCEDVKRILYRALDMHDEEKYEMRINARKTAENSFDYKVYKETVDILFGKVTI